MVGKDKLGNFTQDRACYSSAIWDVIFRPRAILETFFQRGAMETVRTVETGRPGLTSQLPLPLAGELFGSDLYPPLLRVFVIKLEILTHTFRIV